MVVMKKDAIVMKYLKILNKGGQATMTTHHHGLERMLIRVYKILYIIVIE